MGHNRRSNRHCIQVSFFVPVSSLCNLRDISNTRYSAPPQSVPAASQAPISSTASPPQSPGWRSPSPLASHACIPFASKPHTTTAVASAPSSVLTRLLGKLLASANAILVVATSIIQFTGLFDNCWCDASGASLGKAAG